MSSRRLSLGDRFDAWIKSLGERGRITVAFVVVWLIATPSMFLALLLTHGLFTALGFRPVLVGPLAMYAPAFALIVAWKERRMFVGVGEGSDG